MLTWLQYVGDFADTDIMAEAVTVKFISIHYILISLHLIELLITQQTYFLNWYVKYSFKSEMRAL